MLQKLSRRRGDKGAVLLVFASPLTLLVTSRPGCWHFSRHAAFFSVCFYDFRLCLCPAVFSVFFLLTSACLSQPVCLCLYVCLYRHSSSPFSISLSFIYLKTDGQYSPLAVPLYRPLALRNGECLGGCCHYCGVTHRQEAGAQFATRRNLYMNL